MEEGMEDAGASASKRKRESDSDEEDTIAFAIDDKLTPRENAIALTTQLQRNWCPWAHHFEASPDADDVEHLPYHQKAIIEAAKVAGQTLRETGKAFSLALLGNNGDGKSLTTNIILETSSVLAPAYEENIKHLTAEEFKERLIDQGEAVQKLQEMPEVQAALNPAKGKAKATGGDASVSGDLSKVLQIDASKIRLLEEEEEGSAAWKKMARTRRDEEKQDKRMADACNHALTTVKGTILPSKGESRLVMIKSVEKIEKELCDDFNNWDEALSHPIE
ncbi:hypothetical protein T484DRAFT_1828472 [Baffinella frigidus]|nr:hypothetical protein T484DRAFT_1828472 [Cryptophyta sp. CCMP2293]